MVVRYYRDLFSLDLEASGLFITGHFPDMEPGILEELTKEISIEETKRAIMNMGSYKAPRPGGFQVVFLKRTWHIVGMMYMLLLRR